jgi:uncharacterized membrane protein
MNSPAHPPAPPKPALPDHLRFHRPHVHLAAPFGNDWFAKAAEAFARVFGTPTFLLLQTLLVMLWIAVNAIGWTRFDVYPFILLNLAFSLQAAYAAPLILLAQTRQAERDKAHNDADAEHRESLACASAQMSAQMLELLQQNTRLTEMTKELSERIEALTLEMHQHVIRTEARPQP